MGRRTRILLAVLALAVFIPSAVSFYKTWSVYKHSRDIQEYAIAEYVSKADPERAPSESESVTPSASMAQAENNGQEGSGPETTMDRPPVEIDFDGLLEKYPEAQGWIYCEGTTINYPVMQGEDNDKYLHRAYNGEYSAAGSIFLESANTPGFKDSNNIIYGHHMKDQSMFSALSQWASQEYYEEHPEGWLLTPEANYKIRFFSGYVTPADSETYAVYQGPSRYFDAYLQEVAGKSDFKPDPGLEFGRNDRYVVLSTCDYTYEDARYVLHGKLVLSVPSAASGAVSMEKPE